MTADPELNAMSKIGELLSGLSEDQADRVIRWVVDRFGSESVVQPTRRGTGGREESDPQDFETFAELFAAADPRTDTDKALVAAYWLQVVEGEAEKLKSLEVNKRLKHLGHQVNDITSAFDTLMERSPQHVVQLKKEGSTRQARRLYKVTHAGIEHVTEMLRSEEGNDGS